MCSDTETAIMCSNNIGCDKFVTNSAQQNVRNHFLECPSIELIKLAN